MKLHDITLLSIDTSPNRKRTIEILKFCQKLIQFDKVLFITNEEYHDDNFDSDIQLTDKIKNASDYNYFMVTELSNYIETDYVLIVQHDGFILNPKNWIDAYMHYDYIGAPWSYRRAPFFSPQYPYTVGNGGFSLRSKKLLKTLTEMKEFPETPSNSFWPEDALICCTRYVKPYSNGKYLTEILREEKGITFAPYALANEFSVENGVWDGQFGFHGIHTDISRSPLIKKG